MTASLVLAGATALYLALARRHAARLRRSRARLEVLSERAVRERLRPNGSGVEASTIEAPASITTNGKGGR